MPRYKIIIEYCGTDFFGWQVQKGCKTVQGILEKAIYCFSHEITRVKGSGRTDRGVHAKAQVAHFDLKAIIPCNRVIFAINHFVARHQVVVIDCKIVSQNFHSRYSALRRSYEYKIFNRNTIPALEKGKVLWVKQKLDIDLMKKSLLYLIGIHDFSSFRANECQAKSAVINMIHADIIQQGSNITLFFSATSFLQHMIRIIVGSLIQVGTKKIQPIDILKILQSKNRKFAGPTVSPDGLYLTNIEY